MNTTEVAIVGAGPYGLSLAAQLDTAGVPFRIFGRPMQNWREGMPAGMHLKSDGFASDLFDSEGTHTLKDFCHARGIEYDDLRIPVALETFVAYGLGFQATKVPALEERLVTAIERAGDSFDLQLDSGERLRARRVVVASGISHLQRIPAQLANLGARLCTHSCAHHDLTKFAGKRVVVVGGGASAIDTAALLHAVGADCMVVARHPIKFSEGPGPGRRSLWQRLRKPHFGLGSSFRSTLYTLFPNLFHYLPRALRMRIVRRHLGPGAGWFVRPLIEGRVTIHAGYSLAEARELNGGAVLVCVNEQSQRLELPCDHIIAATGYEPAVDKLPFLSPSLVRAVAVEGRTPILSRHFESSVSGLYFMGVIAANSFGPLLRFALGARFCAGTLASHLRQVAARRTESAVPVGGGEQPAE